MITVVLVDDQELVRTGLRALLEHDGDIRVVAEAPDGRRGLDEIRRTTPDVVLMDLRMPVLDGITATRQVTGDPELTAVHVAVLTTFDSDDEIAEAVRAGAAGYLLKDVAPVELRAAVRRLAEGDAFLSPVITRRVMGALAATVPPRTDPALVSGLTARERDVLVAVARGESNAEIARSLGISPATARTHVSRLLTKTRARDRARLVVLAYEAGLVTPGDRSAPDEY